MIHYSVSLKIEKWFPQLGWTTSWAWYTSGWTPNQCRLIASLLLKTVSGQILQAQGKFSSPCVFEWFQDSESVPNCPKQNSLSARKHRKKPETKVV